MVDAALVAARHQQHCIFHCIRVFSISSALQDLSRPSASSSASLARMIGGLALAGATADITDDPTSPKPTRGVRPQAFVSSQGPQSGSSGVTADGAQELHRQASGGGNAAAGLNDQGTDSEDPDQDQAGTSGQWGGSHAMQSDVDGTMRQIGTVPKPKRPAALGQDVAALGQNDAAPAAGTTSTAAAMSNSTAAGAAAGSPTPPWNNGAVLDSNEKGSYRSSNAAANRAALQDPAGRAVSGMGSQGAHADPASIAAYRPEGSAVGDGAGVRIDGQGQGGPKGLGLDESFQRQIADGRNYGSAGGNLDAGRQTKPSGQPLQVCQHVFA